MAVCSTTAPRKYLTQHSNLGQPLREKASSTTGGHAKGETIRNSGRYRRPLFKSSQGGVATARPELLSPRTTGESEWHRSRCAERSRRPQQRSPALNASTPAPTHEPECK